MKRLTSSTLCDLLGVTSWREVLLIPLAVLVALSGLLAYGMDVI